MLGYLSADFVYFQKPTDNVQRKISEHVFTTNSSYGVYYPSNIIATGGIFSKLGNNTWIL